MSDYHEPWEKLSSECRDLHRALVSLKEEIEAVDWYEQRACLAADQSLARILRHNRDEEIEHACMTLEWLRRTVPAWDAQLKRYLFTASEIVKEEPKAETSPFKGLADDVRPPAEAPHLQVRG
ncbi:MAG: encapsulin-associated ferritin-like protein [Polyangiaceae bacterium]|nr:encapsulin-associated ferritin-like protein [Polyangiaceae bacterium]